MIESFNIVNKCFSQKINLSSLNVITGASGSGKTTFLQHFLMSFGYARLEDNIFNTEITFSPSNLFSIRSLKMFKIKDTDTKEKVVYIIDKKKKLRKYVRNFFGSSIYFYNQNNILSFFDKKSCILYLDCSGKYQNILDEYKELNRSLYRYNYKKSSLTKKTFLSLDIINQDIQDLEKIVNLPSEYHAIKSLSQIKDIHFYGQSLIRILDDLLMLLDKKEMQSCAYELERLLQRVGHLLIKEDSVLVEEIVSFLQKGQSFTQSIEYFLNVFKDRYSYFFAIDPKCIDNVYKIIERYNYKGSCIEDLYNILTEMHKQAILVEDKKELYENLIEQNYSSLLKVSQKLYEQRRKHACNFDKLITDYMVKLGIKDTAFKTNISSAISKDGSFSCNEDFIKQEVSFFLDRWNCLIPIDKISGGEMTRVLLSIKIAIKQYEVKDNPALFIFDEIDQGLGGKEIALLAGYFKEISDSCQIIFATHNAHLASCANQHFVILKEGADIKIQNIKGEKRITAISCMFTGKKTSATQLLAKEMISLYE